MSVDVARSGTWLLSIWEVLHSMSARARCLVGNSEWAILDLDLLRPVVLEVIGWERGNAAGAGNLDRGCGTVFEDRKSQSQCHECGEEKKEKLRHCSVGSGGSEDVDSGSWKCCANLGKGKRQMIGGIRKREV